MPDAKVAGPVPSTGGGLARTGLDTFGLVRLAAVLIAAGTVLKLRQRRVDRRSDLAATTI